MPCHVPEVAVINNLPGYKIWRLAIMMGVGSHLYMLLGPPWGNLYISVFLGILINFTGLHTALVYREHVYSQWLIQHFKRLREHQYKVAESDEDHKYNIGQAIEVCKEMELESLLSYTHEHTEVCVKDCMLRYSDMFVIFGDDRTAPLPPGYARKKLAGEDIDVMSGAEDLADDTDTGTDVDAGIDTPGTEDEGKKAAEGRNSKTNMDDHSFNKSNEIREADLSRKVEKNQSPKLTQIDIEKCLELQWEKDIKLPETSKEDQSSGKEIRREDQKLNRLLDQMWQEDIDEEERLKNAKAKEDSNSNPDDDKISDIGDSDVTITENPGAAKGDTTYGKPVEAQSPQKMKEPQTSEASKAPSSPKVKGPGPHKKRKGQKKW